MKATILILMIIAVLFIVLTIYFSIYQLIRKKEYDKIKFLSDYKKGRFFLIYISTFFIYYANALYNNGWGFEYNLTEAIKETINGVVFQINFADIEKFYNSNIFYKFAIILCFVVLVFNTVLFLISLIYPYLLKHKKYNDFIKARHKIIFIGYNDEVLKILNTVDKRKNGCLIIGEINKNNSELLLGKKIAFKSVLDSELYEVDKILFKILSKSKTSEYRIIIHTKNEDKNLTFTIKVNEVMEKYQEYLDIKTYVLGYGDSQTIFNSYMEKSQGRIRYINTYNLIAKDFINRYPITKFMDERHIDYDTATIKKDVNINIYMIGFGKPNQELFLTSIANNQFITIDNNIPSPKRIKYYIYDKNNCKCNKNFNHYYYRLENEENYYKGREEEFLPLDVKPAEIITPQDSGNTIDINDPKFYQYLYQDINNTKENDINYIIVSFGSKIENLDMVDKLASKIHEWGFEQQTKVFVRVNDSKYIDPKSTIRTIENYKESNDVYTCKYKTEMMEITKLNKVNEEEQLYYTFGEEDIIIFDINKIFNNKEEIIAKNRDAVYSLKQDELLSEDKLSKVYEKWYTKTQIQRDSNYYAYLGIRTKLNLLGLDFIDEKLYDSNIHTKVSFEEFYNIYLKNSNAKIDYQKTFNYNNQSLTRTVYKTELDTPSCIRTYLGMQEHLRWNAYTISKGVVQSTTKDIITSLDDGKDYKITRKHNCITTFEGLKELRYLLSIKQFISDELANKCGSDNNISFKQKACELMVTEFDLWKNMFDNLPKEKKEEYLINNDVINYDYQILDDIEWLFKISGYIIIKK